MAKLDTTVTVVVRDEISSTGTSAVTASVPLTAENASTTTLIAGDPVGAFSYSEPSVWEMIISFISSLF